MTSFHASSIFFLSGQLSLGLCLGMALLSAPRALSMPAHGKIAFGIALGPFLTGAFALALVAMMPGVDASLLAWLPWIAAGALALVNRPAWPHFLRGLRRLLAGALMLTPLLWLAGTRMAHYALEPTANADALQYLAEALNLLRYADLNRLPGLAGTADGSLRGDPHGPLWIAYLATAASWNSESPRAMVDADARYAFQYTIVAYAAGLVAFAATFRQRWYSVTVVMCGLTLPLLANSSIGGDRDAFRLAAILLLMTYLAAHSRQRLRSASRVDAWLLGVLIAAIAMQGHGLALAIVPLLLAIWIGTNFLARARIMRIALLALSLAVGVTLGTAHVLMAYLDTGSLTGHGVDVRHQVEGTVYAEGVVARDAARIGEATNLLARIDGLILRDHGFPSSGGVLALLVIPVVYRRLRRGCGRGAEVFFAYGSCAVLTLLVLGLFDYGHYRLGEWAALNPRYAMQWYMASALIAGHAISVILGAFGAGARRWVPVAILFVLSAAVAPLVASRWPLYSMSTYRAHEITFNSEVVALPARCRILAEDVSASFLSDRDVIQLYSQRSRPILRAQTDVELAQIMDAEGICAVQIYTGLYIDRAGPDTPLAKYLASRAFRRIDAGPWRIYMRR